MVRVVLLPFTVKCGYASESMNEMDRNAYPQRTPATYHNQRTKPQYESDHN